ncbi:MAG: VOC family protein [Candidatus Bathyarchaeota archaeon]|jgi:catechol 2,3-dioxygenase-like lactoylglutathione lyase family enzyme|nr:VOC family protein [Candidatus Bathyarchaeota archaeon A05DMB-5]MDH7557404.1 VOC family protein [Candidatus Bathyarchaeota archaeon]
MIKTVWCVTFYVSDLKKAVKFYEEVLGLEKKYEYSSYVGFECGGVEIGLIPKLGKEGKVSFLSPSVEFLVDDVDKTCEELKKKGVKFTKELHDEPWGGRQATFTDPDGNVLEIAQINWQKYFSVAAEGAKKKL